MKYALVNGNKIEAAKGVKGICPSCNSELIARCGDFKINHWSHKGTRNCDIWWENETEWHRMWKNNFPLEWQEIIQFDESTNEKHIADVQTSHNLVIEFQHSHIDPIERQSRERFYKNMIWVVDGTRLQRDYPRFQKKFNEFKPTKQKGVFFVDFVDEVFPKNWLKSSFPVIFDFKGISEDDSDQFKSILWCLLPQWDSFSGYIIGIRKSDFIQIINSIGRLFAESTDEQLKNSTNIRQPQIIFRRREPTHYLQNGRWVKRRRL